MTDPRQLAEDALAEKDDFVDVALLARELLSALDQRDDYQMWNERVRTCAAHTQDVAAPVGDCLICNLDAAEARAATCEQALRFYAEGRHLWEDDFDGTFNTDQRAGTFEMTGAKAREALAAAEETKP